MSALLHNLLEISVSLSLLCMMTIPIGGWLIRWLRFQTGSRGLDFATSAMLGSLLLPFYFNWLGLLGEVSMPIRMIGWLLLNLLLWRLIRRDQQIPTSEPYFDTTLQQWLLGSIAVSAGLITLFPLLLYNVQIDGNWYHIFAGDWIKHIGVGDALVTDNHLPPANPFLSAEPQLRYYYLGYILPAMTVNLSGGLISVTSGLVAQAVLIATCLPLVLYSYARKSIQTAQGALFAVFMVVMVSGLDFLYVLKEHQNTGFWVEHIDFWADHDLRRINSISNMFIWTPQHVLGLLAFIVVLWIMRELWQVKNVPYQARGAVVIALILAALSGTSSFVWFGMLVALGGFALIEGVRWWFFREGIYTFTPLVLIVIAVLASLLLSLPYLSVVGGREESAFRIEISPVVAGLQYGGVFTELLGASPLAYLLDFPIQMSIEFGLVMVTGVWGWWSSRKNQPEFRTWTIFTMIFFLIVLLVRPDRADSNNYAARVAPMAWIILGVLSGYIWRFLTIRKITIGAALLFIGLASTFYEPYIQQVPNYQRLFGGDSSIVRNNYVTPAQYDIYTWLNEHTQPDDIYQIGWESGKALHFVERRTGVAEGYLALLYVSDDLLFHIKQIASMELGFTADDPAQAALGFANVDIDYIVLDETMTLNARNHANFEAYFTLVYKNDVYEIYRIKT